CGRRRSGLKVVLHFRCSPLKLVVVWSSKCWSKLMRACSPDVPLADQQSSHSRWSRGTGRFCPLAHRRPTGGLLGRDSCRGTGRGPCASRTHSRQSAEVLSTPEGRSS